MKLRVSEDINKQAETKVGHQMTSEIEHVARAFYDAHEDAQSWDHEPEIIREEYRSFAREAVRLLAEHEAGKALEGDAASSDYSEAA